ncbi:MAG: mono/diheme cytochrome c family protein [Limisphaerales bacterium]|jgi:mono/diheme cytochrome c family protein
MSKFLITAVGLLSIISCTTQRHVSDSSQVHPVAQQSEYAQHCGSCHLSEGQGVPGAFPPLDTRLGKWAETDRGREYLVKVVREGLIGKIQVDEYSYAGAMPGLASQLSVQQTAAILNYVMVSFSNSVPRFSEQQVRDLSDQPSAATIELRQQL